MFSPSLIKASNDQIPTTLEAGDGLVAVFVGGTSGIGEATLKQFAKRTNSLKPRVYIIGRSQEAGERLEAECKAINANGQFIFIKKDTSLIKNIDEVCQVIESKETFINLLFLTQGTLDFDAKTSEGLSYQLALTYYGRTRFILNFLPLLQQAKGLRRVISVFAGTKEGPMDSDDILGSNVPILKARGHLSSMITLSMEAIAKQAPTVSFIHNYPGFVKSKIARDTKGVIWSIIKVVAGIVGYFQHIPHEDSGDRHVYLATSAAFPPAMTSTNDTLVTVANQSTIAIGSNGKLGSGVYVVDKECQSGGPKVIAILESLREKSIIEKLMQLTQEQFTRITGKEMV